MMAKKESAERELFSKSELLRTVEEHHMIFIRKLKEDMKLFGIKKDWEIHGKEMEIEDLRSYTLHLYDTNDKHKSLLFDTRAKLLEKSQILSKTQENLSETAFKYEDLSKKFTDISEIYKLTLEKNYNQDVLIQEQVQTIEELNNLNKELKEKEEQLNNVQAQNFIMQERIKQLDAHIEGGETGEVIRGDKTFINRGV